jgi:hypothetical protein
MDAFQKNRRGTARDAFAGVLLQRSDIALVDQGAFFCFAPAL